jgi:hypothetical protein
MKLKRFRLTLLSALLVISLLFSGTTYAQDEKLQLPDPGITPDSPFYFFDVWGKKIGLFLAFGPEAKARKALKYAEERLAEAQVMAAKNKPGEVRQATNGYNEFVAIVTEKAKEVERQGILEHISEIVALATSKHLTVLDGVMEIVPEEAREAILQAKEASINGQTNALRALAKQNPERAIEINLATVEGRLKRAKAKAKENEIEELEEALQEFDKLYKFGEEISQIAQGLGKDTTVSELVALATSNHLSILDEVTDVVPVEAKEAILKAKEVSINGMGNALRALAKQNPERAIEINLDTIKGRLDRAKGKAEEGNTEGIEEVLDDTEKLFKFGEEISQIARELGKDTTIIEELVAKATSIQLEVLAAAYEKVPEQAKTAIERVMATSVSGHERAIEALKAKGALSKEVPEEAALPETVPEEAKERISKLKPKVPKPGAPEEVEKEREAAGPRRP